jgi:hypothetical protein
MTNPRLERRLARIASASVVASSEPAPKPNPKPKPKANASRRTADREETYKFGVAEVGGGCRLLCIVRDISTAGARLSVDNPECFPPAFVLQVPMLSLVRRATVRWRSERELGVSFGT